MTDLSFSKLSVWSIMMCYNAIRGGFDSTISMKYNSELTKKPVLVIGDTHHSGWVSENDPNEGSIQQEAIDKKQK